jgi:hypothetical protein
MGVPPAGMKVDAKGDYPAAMEDPDGVMSHGV